MPTDLGLVQVRPARWEPWDCCAVFLVRHVVFANWQRKLWRGRAVMLLGPDVVARAERADTRPHPLIVPPGAPSVPPAHDPAVLAPVVAAMTALGQPAATAALGGPFAGDGESGGSNSWVLDGTRTGSGLPLLAGDPHRLVEVPGVYAQGRARVRRVRRDRARLRRRPRLRALRPQRTGRVVRDERQRRLPGPLRRALRGRGSITLRDRRVLARRPAPARDRRGARRRPGRGRLLRDAARTGGLRRPGVGPRDLDALDRAGRPEHRSRRAAADVAVPQCRRARRRDARVGRPGQQPPQRRSRRSRRLPHRRPHPGAGPGGRVGPGAGVDG